MKAMAILLREAKANAPMPPPHNIGGVRHALKSTNPRAGQGPDHQVLKQWAFLPEEALRFLLLLIYQMEAGTMPMQTLMVYIGLFWGTLLASSGIFPELTVTPCSSSLC